MAESMFHCPLSARISRGEQPLYCPVDAGPERLEASENAQRVAADHGLSTSDRCEESSDALFDVYKREDGYWLVSRIAFSADDLDLIVAELLDASSQFDASGVLGSSVTADGHLLVQLDYEPIVGRVRGAEDVQALFADLRRAHARGLVHGGINDRWIRPEAAEGRRVFGYGLAEAYAAWRRHCGLQLGDLVSDPRFASAAVLRGERPTQADDRYALAALCLTELASDAASLPSLQPVQGVNAFLGRAASVRDYAAAFHDINDPKVEKILESSLLMEEPSKGPLWLIPIAIALGLILLLQIFAFFRSPTVVVERSDRTLVESESVICSGRGVVREGNECRVADNTGRCGEGTRFDAARGECVSASPPASPSQAADDDGTTEASAEDVQSPYIHPVLECSQGQSRLDYKFSFSNDDINLTLGEKSSLSRLAERCAGAASIVYYTSSPGLEDRARTIFDEFRSSSICGEKCQEVMPPEPTSVVYVPNIDMLDRANQHYMFFQCCER